MLPHRDVLRWENGSRQIELQKQFVAINQPLLSQLDKSPFNYNPDLPNKANRFHRYNESREAHGYPATAWL